MPQAPAPPGSLILVDAIFLVNKGLSKVATSVSNYVEKQKAADAARKAELKAKEDAEQRRLLEFKRRWKECIRNDDDIMGRYEELSMMTPLGGTIAIIRRQYDYYLSEWIYSLNSDGTFTRRRNNDGAQVEFSSLGELIDDFHRYRHCDFSLYVPQESGNVPLS